MANIKSFPNNQDDFIGAEKVMKWLHGRTSGVFAAGGQCAVAAVADSMSVTVSDGNGWVSNSEGDGIVWWISNEKDTGTKLTLTGDMADATLPRIDRVVASWPTTNYVAYPEVFILKGTPASNPKPPALTNNNTMRQISLAQIRTPAGATAITNSMITDERLDPTVCGLVTESIQVDTSVINAQLLAAYQEYTRNMDQYTAESRAAFEAWFEAVKDALSGDVAGNLQNQINALRVEARAYTDTKVNDMGLVTATHTKSGTTHAITAPAGCGNLKFVAAVPYEDGDTITLNGTAVTPKTQDGEALTGGAWAAGAVVMALVSPDGGTLFFKGGGGGTGKSEIIVTAPTGSTVTASCGAIVKTAKEKNGTWTFKGCGIGLWTLTATHPNEDEPAIEELEISETDQLMRYYISIDFQPYPDDFDFSQFGIKGFDYEIVDNDRDDAVIPIEDYRKYKNWKCRLLTSGNGPIIPLKDAEIDVFAVGGGAGTPSGSTGGAGSGYTNTGRCVKIIANATYLIEIGAGGIGGVEGGTTSAFGIDAPGGSPCESYNGGPGGSGGSGYNGSSPGNNGGFDGSDGIKGTNGSAGLGQGKTTREFGELSGKLYAGGGAGGNNRQGGAVGLGGPGGGGNGQANGVENTGGGAGGGCYSGDTSSNNGGSGIVVFRPHKKEAA